MCPCTLGKASPPPALRRTCAVLTSIYYLRGLGQLMDDSWPCLSPAAGGDIIHSGPRIDTEATVAPVLWLSSALGSLPPPTSHPAAMYCPLGGNCKCSGPGVPIKNTALEGRKYVPVLLYSKTKGATFPKSYLFSYTLHLLLRLHPNLGA